MTNEEFITLLIYGITFGFGFSAFLGIVGYFMQSLKNVIFKD